MKIVSKNLSNFNVVGNPSFNRYLKIESLNLGYKSPHHCANILLAVVGPFVTLYSLPHVLNCST
jgi:hypothetical protein